MEMRKLALVALVAMGTSLAPTAMAQNLLSGRDRSFVVGMNGNEERVLGTNGPLTFFVRCRLDQPANPNDPTDPTTIDLVSFWFISAVDGWFQTVDRDITGANQEARWFDRGLNPETPEFSSVTDARAFAVSPAGDVLQAQITGVGNLLGFRCLATGSVIEFPGHLE
jgi:hypothetical protein